MILPRVIPILLLHDRGLVKGVRFGAHTYIGDPINTVQIFNTKQVDEILLLDIAATREGRIPDLATIQRLADECLMPFGVGGGITRLREIKDILGAGAEKVCICTAAVEHPALIREASRTFGNQSIVVSIDVKQNRALDYEVYVRCGTQGTGLGPIQHAQNMEQLGAGEILVNSIDRDGSMEGYDGELIAQLAAAVTIPVIVAGGAGSNEHLRQGLAAGASAVAAGSMFVLHGKRRAVLISYPDKEELDWIRTPLEAH